MKKAQRIPKHMKGKESKLFQINLYKFIKPVISFVLFLTLISAYFAAPLLTGKAADYEQIEKYSAGSVVKSGELTVHFIDVGQGDACLIELPDDRTMLIDAGDNNSRVKDKLKSYVDGVNETRLNNNRSKITFFDFVVLTHSDADHCGSLTFILDLYPAKIFYRPNEEAAYTGSDNQKYRDPALDGDSERNRFWSDGSGHSSKTTVTYKNAIETGYKFNESAGILPEGIVTNPHDDTQNVIKPNDDTPLNLYYEINFYGPVKSKFTDLNNNSPIIILEYKDRRIALSGDCEKEGEAEFVSKAKEGQGRYAAFNDGFNVDVIKAGHHGSRTSSSTDYLNTLTSPDYVKYVYIVISCGTGNSYGHPHAEVLDRFNQMNFSQERVLRTDLSGDIAFVLVLFEEETKASIKLAGEEEKEEDKEGGDENEIPIDEPIDVLPQPFWKKCGFFGGIDVDAGAGTGIIVFLAIILSSIIFIKRKPNQNIVIYPKARNKEGH